MTGTAPEEEGRSIGTTDPRARIRHRVTVFRWLGRIFRGGTTVAAAGIVALALALLLLLAENAGASLRRFGFGFLTGTTWNVSAGVFGAAPFIAGTLLTSALALLLAVPLALGVALFTAEIAPPSWRAALAYVVDLGAMVPSVVYGFWGLVVLVPFMRQHVEPALTKYTHGAGGLLSGLPLGVSVLTAGVILAVMVVPTISALSREALRAVPRERREAALGLGATRWEATRLAVLGPASPGILGAVILGLGRALGETIAVALVIGGVPRIPTSFLAPGATIPSFLLNRFGDPGSPLALSALFELGLILLALSLLINVGARLLLTRSPDDEAPPSKGWFRRGHHPAPGPVRPAAVPSVRPPAWWARVSAERPRRALRRRAVHAVLVVLTAGAVVAAVYPLYSLTRLAVENGGAVILRPSFYTQPIPPACLTNCSLGGIGPAIEGTALLVGLAAVIGVPVGLLAGIYLSEYGRNRYGRAVGIVTDALVGVPTLLVGFFVLAVLLRYDRLAVGTALAGGLALSIIVIPIVTRTTEAALRTVPTSVRESALALGFPRHRVTLRVVLGSSRSALLTGTLLALGRAAGETAALLFTVGWTTYAFSGWNQPVPALAPFIFEALENGYPNWITDAWGAALVLLLIMLGLTIASRLTLRTNEATGTE